MAVILDPELSGITTQSAINEATNSSTPTTINALLSLARPHVGYVFGM